MTESKHLFQPKHVVNRLRTHSDAVLQMQVIAGTSKQDVDVYKNCHGCFGGVVVVISAILSFAGQLHIVKLPTIGTLKTPSPATVDLVFKLTRSKLSVEVSVEVRECNCITLYYCYGNW